MTSSPCADNDDATLATSASCPSMDSKGIEKVKRKTIPAGLIFFHDINDFRLVIASGRDGAGGSKGKVCHSKRWCGVKQRDVVI